MKYILDIDINKPIERVIDLFDNPDNMSKWMKGLVSFDHLSGTQGQPGAKSRLKFKMGNRDVEMIETIKVRNLPDEFSGTYEVKGVFNTIKNKFVRLSDNKTKYISEQEFEFQGFMKVIAFLMPGVFKKQTKKYLEDFKNFVESQN